MPDKKRSPLPTPPAPEAGIEAFFSRAIVGGPMSLELGSQTRPTNLRRIGVEIAPKTLVQRVSEDLLDVVAIEHVQLGKPQRKPSRTRRMLERFSLPIAITGLCLCAAALLSLILG